jgi:hypothetical protein
MRECSLTCEVSKKFIQVITLPGVGVPESRLGRLTEYTGSFSVIFCSPSRKISGLL